MNSKGSQPPTLAVWLLRHLCPKGNDDALTGDLFERFGERQSDGWFWRQVLIAILVGVSKELRVHWPQICWNSVALVLIDGDHTNSRDRATLGLGHRVTMAYVDGL